MLSPGNHPGERERESAISGDAGFSKLEFHGICQETMPDVFNFNAFIRKSFVSLSFKRAKNAMWVSLRWVVAFFASGLLARSLYVFLYARLRSQPVMFATQ